MHSWVAQSWVAAAAGTFALCVLSAYGFLRLRVKGIGRLFGPRSRWRAAAIIVVTALASTGVGLAVAAISHQILAAYVGILVPSVLRLDSWSYADRGLGTSRLRSLVSAILAFPLRLLYDQMGEDMQAWCDARFWVVVPLMEPRAISGAAQYYYDQVKGRIKDRRALAELSGWRDSIEHKANLVRLIAVETPARLQAALQSHPSTRNMDNISAADLTRLAGRLISDAQNDLNLLLVSLYRLGYYKLPVYQYSTPESPASARIKISDREDTGPPEVADSGGTLPRPYLRARCPDSVAPEQVFSLRVSVVLGERDALPSGFEVPRSGLSLLILIHAPGLLMLSEPRQTVHVSAAGTSGPVAFEFKGVTEGRWNISITAWNGGSYLGELVVEVVVEVGAIVHEDHTQQREISIERADGEVTLVVHYDPRQKLFQFQFLDVDNPQKVVAELPDDPGPSI